MSDSKGHEPREIIEPQGTTRHTLIKCRFDDDADSKCVQFQVDTVAGVNQHWCVSFKKLIKAPSQFQCEQPINGSLWNISLGFAKYHPARSYRDYYDGFSGSHLRGS